VSHPYDDLVPDVILQAVEQVNLEPDGHLLALNSYENRVFQVGIEERAPLIAKFYRPDRWSDAAILEEHRFAQTLDMAEVPVVAPWTGPAGQTLFSHADFRFALFPRRGGRAPEPGDLVQLGWIGRFIGRLHLAGQGSHFTERPILDVHTLGWPARDSVMQSPLMPMELAGRYSTVTAELLNRIEEIADDTAAEIIRLHGDCHHGNILWTDAGPHFVDLDDCRNGPAVQDLWMLLNGPRNEQASQLGALIEGYRMFRDFDPRELALIEPLRTLRMIHHSGWVAKRWDDPAFPGAFSWMASPHYWAQHVEDLEHQRSALAAQPLTIG
jgi:Ser/Thr protein kinase RdoA (MazF antagonist)